MLTSASTIRLCGMVLALGVATARHATAQALPADSSRAFEVPTPPLLCHVGLRSARDTALRAAYAFEFRDGVEPNDRSIDVGYDSAGHPRFLSVEQWHEPALGHFEEHVIAIAFGGADSAAGVRYRMRSSDPNPRAMDRQNLARRREVLTRGELAKGRGLAEWLWEHRCGRATH